MRRLTMVAKAGDWPEAEAIDSVTLGFDDRHRRRLRLTTDQGEGALLDLTRPQPLDEGDGLAFENEGGWVRIKAAAEDVLAVQGRDLVHALRLAWNLGNRHMPAQIMKGGELRIRYDHVIEEMLISLGASVKRIKAPFTPEGNGFGRTSPR